DPLSTGPPTTRCAFFTVPGRWGVSLTLLHLTALSAAAGLVPRSRAGFGLVVGPTLVRADHHDHVASVLLRLGLDRAQFLNVLGQTCQQPAPEFGPGLFTTTEHDRHLDLVPTLEEPDDVTLLGLVVVRVDLRAELDLLDDRVRLVLARLACLDRGLVLELAVVHQLGDRRTGGRRDLDQVEIGFLGQTQCVLHGNDSGLLTVGPDESDLGHPDAVIDAGLGADGTPP